MLQKAKIIAIHAEGSAEIEVTRESACGHDCGSCAGCGMQAAPIRADAQNSIGAQVGDIVEIETETSKIITIAGIVYLFPLVLFFLVYILLHGTGQNEALAISLGGLGFVCGLLVAVVLNHHVCHKGDVRFIITTIIERKH